MVPVSALTGEGVSDLILLLVANDYIMECTLMVFQATFCQRFLPNRLAVKPGPLICRVLEVRETVGMGVCVDVILVQGSRV